MSGYSGAVPRVWGSGAKDDNKSGQGVPRSKGDGSKVADDSWWLSGGIDPASVAGVWQPKGAASLDASYLRLAGDEGYADIDPAVVGGVAPTFGVDGWVFNGSTQYLKIGVIPTNVYTGIARASDITTKTAVLFGVLKNGKPFKIFPRLNPKTYYQNYGTQNYAKDRSSGVWAMSGAKPYYNGVYEGSDIATQAYTYDNLFIGASNEDGSLTQYLNGRIQAIAIYKSTLTAPQVLAVSTAMVAL